MSFLIHRFAASVTVSAEREGLALASLSDLTRREGWPGDALAAAGGWRSAIEIEQLLEAGLAEDVSGGVRIPYGNFQVIQKELAAHLIEAWTPNSPFLLKIDRKSDVGHADFRYRYSFVLGGKTVSIERLGYYVKRAAHPEIFLLDSQMFSLLEAMDGFNSLPPEAKTPQRSWLTFATVKGCAKEVGAALDGALQMNDVIVPSMLGLDMREHNDGTLTFLPRCEELAGEEFHQVFERNPGAEKLYSLDRPGLGRLRVVLTDEQHQVLQRMKRVRARGELKERLLREPGIAFDGLRDYVELPYGERVIGVGEFQFAPTPRPMNEEPAMAGLWEEAAGFEQAQVESDALSGVLGSDGAAQVRAGEGTPDGARAVEDAGVAADSAGSVAGAGEADSTVRRRGDKYLLIETNEESVKENFLSEAERARRFANSIEFERPRSLRENRTLRAHQERGVRWLQTCSLISQRSGVLLADDMGAGKTIQVLTFLAWCMESGRFPDLAKREPPFRPILIIAPLILVDTRIWESEMERFFENDGVVFWPVLSLHGEQLAKLRRDDAEGREWEVGQPLLDLDRILRHRVVITNYETVKNYQHSFAYMKGGAPLWSFIVTDEAQEYKVPSTKVSHAVKALKARMHIACTGTPVENRLLDLWNICDAFQPGLLSSAREFVEQFEANRNRSREESLTELKKKLLFQQPHAFLLRRTKAEIAELPQKQIVRLDCEMSDAEVAAHQSFLADLRRDDRPSRYFAILQKFSQLYQHPALLKENAEDWDAPELVRQSSKMRALLTKLHEIRGRREKAIIFVRLRTMQALLSKVLQAEFRIPVRIINGETKLRGMGMSLSGSRTRNAILQEFRGRPGFNVLILSPFVAGIGLTIVEANHVFHYGRWWNPAVEAQATDRAYRIGQTKEVSVYLPILRDPSGRVAPTFDERLDALMDRKQRLAEDFLRPLPAEDGLSGELMTELRTEAGVAAGEGA
jgi:hypothetical protein